MELWALVSLVGVLVVVGWGLWWGLPWGMARKLLRPPRMTDGKAVYVLKRLTPQDLGMGYEEVAFEVRDERTGKPLHIAGWWIPYGQRGSATFGRPSPWPSPGVPGEGERGGKTVVLVHGYADAKVGAIAWGPVWQGLGYHILAIDLRGHGESGGVDVTAGYWERHDLSQVVDQMKARWVGETREVVLFGVSLGAAVVAGAAGMRDDLKAVVMESPFSDYPSAVEAHADLMGMPGPSFVRRAVRRAEKMSGAKFMEVAPVKTIGEARCRVMVISAGGDPLVGGALPLLEKAVEGRGDRSVFWEVGGAYHVECLLGEGEGYGEKLGSFLRAERAGHG